MPDRQTDRQAEDNEGQLNHQFSIEQKQNIFMKLVGGATPTAKKEKQ